MFLSSCRLIRAAWFSAVVMCLIVSISKPVEPITIHPAVLKNFVGPFRLRQQYPPVLRQAVPFTLEDELEFSAPLESQPEEEETSISDSVFGPRHEAVRERKTVFDQHRALRACRGQAPCRRNLDSTLNLLMKMMETGR